MKYNYDLECGFVKGNGFQFSRQAIFIPKTQRKDPRGSFFMVAAI